MKRRVSIAAIAVAAITASIALAQAPQDPKRAPTGQPPKDAAPHAGQQPQLPPGWTEADMQACIEAGTPGAEHERLAESIGVWKGQSKMWMAPDAPPIESECTTTVTAFMDGRYTRCEMNGEMPGMGPFNGLGIYGFDNVAEKYQCTWVDNHSTMQMHGTGEMSSDGKTMTWNFNYTCPITRKPTTMREVETWTGKDAKTMEMYGKDPKTGEEFKMMEIAMTRTPGATATGSMR